MPSICRDCHHLSDVAHGRCFTCGSDRIVSHPELTSLSIAHIDCDAFYASVEKRDRPEIRDQPLIVGHAGGRGVVTTACYIARKYGVRSAMPMFKAMERCPDAVVLPPDMAKYRQVSQEIRAIFLATTPVIEPVSLDEAYLDFSNRSDAVACAAEELVEIARRIEREVRLTVSIGLAPNKLLAKLASDLDKPRGFSIIGRAEARSFLAGLPVGKINGIGPATAARMEQLGIATVGDLQRMSEAELVARFGKFGQRLATYVQGEDDREVTPSRPTKSVSAETTFRQDTGAATALKDAIRPMCDRIASQLVRKKLSGHTVTVKLKTSDFKVLSRNQRLANPTQRAEAIFEAASMLIDKEAGRQTFRLVGVGVSGLGPDDEADPPDLFGS